MTQINILNGDCAYNEWLKSGLPGNVLIWRENYLHGYIPATSVLSEFNRVRAIELHKIAPDKPENEIYAELEQTHHRLLALKTMDSVTLWFDICPFDRTMLARILFLLNTMPEPPKIKLICKDIAWSSKTFLFYQHDGITLQQIDLQYGHDQWLALIGGTKPETLLTKLCR